MIDLTTYKQLTAEMTASGHLYNLFLALCNVYLWQEAQEEKEKGQQEDDDED